MFDWIIKNKEWVFSGIGVLLVTAMFQFLYKKRGQDTKLVNSDHNVTFKAVVGSTVTIHQHDSRQVNQDNISPKKNIHVESFIIHQSSCGNIANLIFILADEKVSEPYAKITINTINLWDFPNGETAPSLDFIVPNNDISCLFISPKIDASTNTNVTFTDNKYGQKELKVRLYTDHLIMDKHLHSYIGVTLFMLKITLSTKDFQEWTTTAIVQLAGGTAKTTGLRGITEVEFDKQKAAAKEILQAVKNGVKIDGTIESKLHTMILSKFPDYKPA